MSAARVAALDLADDATAAALVTLQRASYRVEADLIGVHDLPPLRETPRQLQASGETFLGALAGEDIVGAVSYKRHGDTVAIHRLVVHPDVFRRGIGTALLEALDATEAPARTVVAAAAVNLPARRLYERAGFRLVLERTVAGGVRILELERRRRP
jgi:ribosomal protein S18 acetylase RimI-like enzyme